MTTGNRASALLLTRSARIVLKHLRHLVTAAERTPPRPSGHRQLGRMVLSFHHMLPMAVRVYSGRVPDTPKEQVFKPEWPFERHLPGGKGVKRLLVLAEEDVVGRVRYKRLFAYIRRCKATVRRG